MGTAERVAVCVPARNEAATLPLLLDALARQEGVAVARVILCLFLDGCGDDSRALIERAATDLPFPCKIEFGLGWGAPNAGLARRTAMAMGVGAVDADGVLLTTDADSAPRRDWIAASMAALAKADIVAGRIVRESAAPSPGQDRVEAYYDRLHRLRRRIDPVAWEDEQSHHFTGGASLGFRAAAYSAVGGFAPVPSGEDALIGDEAARAGLALRRDARVVVRTSARREGRATGGLAAALSQFDASERPVIVAHPQDEAWRYTMQARARSAHGRMDETARAALAHDLSLALDEVRRVERETCNGEAFAMRLVSAPPGGMRQLPLDAAETALARLAERVLRIAA